MSRVLIIDDDAAVRRSLDLTLRQAGFTVATASSGEEGLLLARQGGFDVVLTDLKMPGLSGLDVVREVSESGLDAALIVMTAYGTIETAVEAMKLGAVDYVQKPFFRDELVLRITAAIERRRLTRQVRLLQRQLAAGASLGALVGTSAAMEAVRAFVRRAAESTGTVLITGETGTGKELVARAIHHEGPRAGGPFVPVNCAGLAESLLDSELFGHARGAFTGAREARAGLVEHAHTGTLFLDEIGAMPRTLQAKLLRTLESGEIRRLGENTSRTVDVRFIAATNVKLKDAVAAGEFREDLFYRLHVLTVHLPPLRERREDIPLLIDHFLAKYGAPGTGWRLSEAARAALMAYDYPGNVRELDHIIQRAVAIARGTVVELDELPDEVVRPGGAPAPGGVAAARARAERERLRAALARRGGDLAETARELGISRTTLWRLMRKHGLSA